MKILCEERDLGENSIKAIDQVFIIVLHITKDEGATPIRCEQGTEICQSATDQLGNQDFSCSSTTGIIKGSGDSIATASRVPQRRLCYAPRLPLNHKDHQDSNVLGRGQEDQEASFRSVEISSRLLLLHLVAPTVLNVAFAVDGWRLALPFLAVLRSSFNNLIYDFDGCNLDHIESRGFLIAHFFSCAEKALGKASDHRDLMEDLYAVRVVSAIYRTLEATLMLFDYIRKLHTPGRWHRPVRSYNLMGYSVYFVRFANDIGVQYDRCGDLLEDLTPKHRGFLHTQTSIICHTAGEHAETRQNLLGHSKHSSPASPLTPEQEQLWSSILDFLQYLKQLTNPQCSCRTIHCLAFGDLLV